MTTKVVEDPSYRLEFQFEAPRLCARIARTSDTGLSVSSAYWLRIAEEVRATGADELLVIDGLQGEVMCDADLERFFVLMEGSGLEHARIAYVEGRMDQMPRIEYAELMARERGFTVRMFSNESDAAIWLRHGML